MQALGMSFQNQSLASRGQCFLVFSTIQELGLVDLNLAKPLQACYTVSFPVQSLPTLMLTAS